MATQLFSLPKSITKTQHTDIVKAKPHAFVRQTGLLSLVLPKDRGTPDKRLGTHLSDLTTILVNVVGLADQIQRCSRFRG